MHMYRHHSAGKVTYSTVTVLDKACVGTKGIIAYDMISIQVTARMDENLSAYQVDIKQLHYQGYRQLVQISSMQSLDFTPW